MKLPKCALEAALGGGARARPGDHDDLRDPVPGRAMVIARPTSKRTLTCRSFYRVPLASIDKIEHRRALDGVIRVSMALKDARTMKLVLTATSQVENAIKVLLTYAFPGRIELLFAFNHRLRARGARMGRRGRGGRHGPSAVDVMREFERQGVLRPRRLIPRGGREHDAVAVACLARERGPPAVRVVPVAARGCPPSATIRCSPRSRRFAPRGALPTLSWGSSTTAASIWRSSQPKVGVAGASSPADERMLTAIALAGTLPADASARPADGPAIERSKSVCHIVDCRPRSNATANKLTGHGYESAANYPYCSLSFWNIGNIHVMRESLAALVALAHSDGAPLERGGRGCERGGVGTAGGATGVDAAWLSRSRARAGFATCASCSPPRTTSSRWSRHATRPSSCTAPHGWDRTAQVCALAQLLLDPYFRTSTASRRSSRKNSSRSDTRSSSDSRTRPRAARNRATTSSSRRSCFNGLTPCGSSRPFPFPF